MPCAGARLTPWSSRIAPYHPVLFDLSNDDDQRLFKILS